MNLQLTDAGVAALNADTGRITLNLFKIGDAFGYVPSPTDIDIHGALQYEGMPSAPVNSNANVVKYGCYMDYSVGPFAWGEFGLFMDTGVLFAIGCSSTLLQKLKQNGVDPGNSVRLDIYLSIVDQNYEMWMDIGESNNKFRLAVLQSPDLLPPSKDATPNAYVVQSASADQTPMLAFTDRTGLWSFDCYAFINQVGGTIIGFDSQSVTIDTATYTSDMHSDYFGELIFEFTSGADYSICRYIQSATNAGGVWKLGFATPLLIEPVVGDTFIIFKRQALSLSNVVIPIASTTLLGGVKIGTGITITPDGTISIDPVTSGLVTSVNGMTGDVILVADDIEGISAVGKSGQYADLLNPPQPYQLPAGSVTVRGGYKLPVDGKLITTATDVLTLGFNPVLSVGNVAPDANGNVNYNPPGLNNPVEIPDGNDLNNYQTSGLFFINAPSVVLNAPSPASGTVEIVPNSTGITGDVVQRFSNATDVYWRKLTGTAWSGWAQTAKVGAIPVPPATTTSLGAVIVGSGLGVLPDGTLSAAVRTVNAQTGDVLITAESIGAMSALTVGSPGGLAGYLSENKLDGFNNPTIDTLYVGSRLPIRQNSISTGCFAGAWDAGTNTIQAYNPFDYPNQGNTSLLPNGIVNIPVPDPVSGVVTNIPVEGTGRIYVVSDAGTTPLDGTSFWNVGDIVMALRNRWLRIKSNVFINNITANLSVNGTNLPSIFRNTGATNLTATMTVDGDPLVTPIAIGTEAIFYQVGAGTITVVPAAGVTINTAGALVTNGVGSDITLKYVAPNTWDAIIPSSVKSFNTRTGAITLTRADVNTAVANDLQGSTTMEVRATGANSLFLNKTSGSGGVYFGNGAGGTPAFVDSGGNGFFTNATATSDLRLKSNVKALSKKGLLARIAKIDVITYSMKGKPNVKMLNVSAQSMLPVFPNTVVKTPDGKGGWYYSVSTMGEAAIAIAGVQVLTEEIEALKKTVKYLMKQLEKGNTK